MKVFPDKPALKAASDALPYPKALYAHHDEVESVAIEHILSELASPFPSIGARKQGAALRMGMPFPEVSTCAPTLAPRSVDGLLVPSVIAIEAGSAPAVPRHRDGDPIDHDIRAFEEIAPQ
jgi:hypothetical protein